MADFPQLFGGQAALYPLQTEKRFDVTVLQFSDFTEQRFVRSAGLNRFSLRLAGMSTAEKQDILDFFETTKGSYDATWTLTIAGTDYDYMAFAADQMSCVEGEDGTWSIACEVVQTRKN